MMKKSTHLRAVALWLMIPVSMFLVVACSAAPAGPTGPSPVGDPTSTPASSTDGGATSLDGLVLGTGHYPSFTVQAPSPWSASGGYFVTNNNTGGVDLGIMVWDVGQVSRNPCHWRGHLYNPGPTVNDLVAALESRPMRDATPATDVTLGGYRGRYLQWSVPAHLVVTGDSDFAGCDLKPNGHRDYVSWFGQGMMGDRWQQMAGQVDRLWVLNVNGQRLVVDATYSPNATTAERDQLDQVVQSLHFVSPAA